MCIIRYYSSIIALSCVFCGFRDRNLAQGELLPLVKHVAIQLRENGGRNLSTIHICEEIEREILGITNKEMRIQYICNASTV